MEENKVQEEVSKPAPSLFVIEEAAANELLLRISKLPWEVANPLIVFMQQNIKKA